MKRRYLAVGVLLLYCYLSGFISKVDAAILFLEPNTKNVKTGDTFEVTLKIDTQGEKPLAADALLLFDSSNLELTEVKDPPEADKFFPEFYKRISNNKIYIGAAVGPGGTAKAGKGSIAVLVFRGSTQSHNIVSFVCADGKTVDSNISVKQDKTVTDVITCSSLKDATYDVSATGTGTTPPAGSATPSPSGGTPRPSGSGSPSPTGSLSPSVSPTPTLRVSISPTVTITATPTAILSPVPSTSPTPSGLPNTGVVETTTMAIGIGIVLTIISIGIKLAL